MLPDENDAPEGEALKVADAVVEVDVGNLAEVLTAIKRSANRRFEIITHGFTVEEGDPRDQRQAVEILGMFLAVRSLIEEVDAAMQDVEISQEQIGAFGPDLSALMESVNEVDNPRLQDMIRDRTHLMAWERMWGNSHVRSTLKENPAPAAIRVLGNSLWISALHARARQIADKLSIDLRVLAEEFVRTKPLHTFVGEALTDLGIEETRREVLERVEAGLEMQGKMPPPHAYMGVNLLVNAIMTVEMIARGDRILSKRKIDKVDLLIQMGFLS